MPDRITGSHGDAAFADYVWFASYSYRFGGPATPCTTIRTAPVRRTDVRLNRHYHKPLNSHRIGFAPHTARPTRSHTGRTIGALSHWPGPPISPHAIVLWFVLDLCKPQHLHDRRNIHREAASQPFLEPVPPADRVLGYRPTPQPFPPLRASVRPRCPRASSHRAPSASCADLPTLEDGNEVVSCLPEPPRPAGLTTHRDMR